MNEMHAYEFKSFLKIHEFNPYLPKTFFLIDLSLKTQTVNTFCIIIKEILILDGHNKITQYHVLSLAKNNLCSVCN